MKSRPFLSALLIVLGLTILAILASFQQVPPPDSLDRQAVARTQTASPVPPPSEDLMTGKPLSKPIELLTEPIVVDSFETTIEALPVWRQFRDHQPTLLLLSNGPYLAPVPEQLSEQAEELASSATTSILAGASNSRTADPTLLPAMAVDLALSNNWFAQFIWGVPLPDPQQDLDLGTFREQLTGGGMINEAEGKSLNLSGNIFRGDLRGTPFTAAALPLLSDISQPVIVHIDLSYFKPLYRNEIKTPLLQIVSQTLVALKEKHLQTLAVTFSYGHLDHEIALDVRFLGEVITGLIEHPERLDQAIPLNWSRQSDTLYLANFFKKEKIREIHQAQEQDAPRAAWVKFSLYRSAAEFKEGKLALEKLSEAVALDKMYALEYLNLSQLAFERGRPDEAIRMLRLASDVFPDDPFIKLEMAQLAVEMDDDQTARHLVEQLQELQWSPVYFAQMPDYLAGFASYLTATEPAAKPSDHEHPEEQRRQRVLHSGHINPLTD